MQRTLPDVDTLRKMAIDNPAKLESLRRNLAQQIIDQAAPENRARLQGLQFEIDAHCLTAPNPVAACIKISAMMRKSFERLHSTLNIALETGALDLEPINDTQHLAPPSRTADIKTGKTGTAQQRTSAKILAFKPH